MASIVESSDEGIIGQTLDGTIINWNKGPEKLFGYSPEEVKGQPTRINQASPSLQVKQK